MAPDPTEAALLRTESPPAAQRPCIRASAVAPPGVTVVNIDNGYGAACAALRIIHAFAEPRAGANPC
jgi:hypothetical protein